MRGICCAMGRWGEENGDAVGGKGMVTSYKAREKRERSYWPMMKRGRTALRLYADL